MLTDVIPASIVRGVLEPQAVVAVQAMPAGMSGASVFQCRLDSGELRVLKRWPDGTRRSRVEEVHRVVRHAKANGFSLVPALHPIAGPGQACLTHRQSHWELAQWMPGQAASRDATLDLVRLGASAIAQFHASVQDLGGQFQPAPAIQSRLKRLDHLATLVPAALSTDPIPCDPGLARPIQQATKLLRWKWDEVRDQIARSLSQYADRNVFTQYVLRDIHREHVLFTGQQSTGMIDFDAIRIDTPATDLARWVGSFQAGREDSDALWEAALAGFHDQNTFYQRPVSEIDPRMARDLCYATTWISVANWLVWLVVQRRRFPAGPQAVAARIHELVAVASPGV